MRNATRLACCSLAAAAVAVGHAAPDASARTLTAVTESGKKLRGPYQRWIDRSRAPTVRGRVRIVLSGCPARPRLAGCVYARRLHTIYVKRGTRGMRKVVYHELGHLFDFRLMSPRERREYKRLIGRRGRAWFGGTNPPGEQFAEAYTLCALKRRIGRSARGDYGFRTSVKRHASACALIRRAAGPTERPKPPPRPPVVTGPPPPANAPPAQPPEEDDESLLERLIPG